MYVIFRLWERLSGRELFYLIAFIDRGWPATSSAESKAAPTKSLLILFDDFNLITTADFAFFQNPGEHAFKGHDTVTRFIIDCTLVVTFLADLGNFYQNLASQPDMGPDWQRFQ